MRNSCWNTNRMLGLWVKDGLVLDSIKHPELGIINVGRYRMKHIDDVMTITCNYKTTTPDERCKGCLK